MTEVRQYIGAEKVYGAEVCNRDVSYVAYSREERWYTIQRNGYEMPFADEASARTFQAHFINEMLDDLGEYAAEVQQDYNDPLFARYQETKSDAEVARTILLIQ